MEPHRQRFWIPACAGMTKWMGWTSTLLLTLSLTACGGRAVTDVPVKIGRPYVEGATVTAELRALGWMFNSQLVGAEEARPLIAEALTLAQATGAPAAFARSLGAKVLTKGTAVATPPTAPAQPVAISQVRLP